MAHERDVAVYANKTSRRSFVCRVHINLMAVSFISLRREKRICMKIKRFRLWVSVSVAVSVF